MNILCIGLGYTAEALGSRLAPRGWQIAGTARTSDGLARIRTLGFDAIPFDGTSPAPEVSEAIARATHILMSAGPTQTGDPLLAHHARDIAAAPRLAWIGYLSTIGVYGDTGGAWIDETATPRPGSERTRRRLAAEDDWLGLARTSAKQTRIFRLGGIYGPGRSAIDDLARGEARRIVKPGQVFNRIHVDDIASVLLASAEGHGSHDVYNVTDGEPSPPQDVVLHAARLMGVDPPPEIPFEEAPLSPMGLSFYAENRRVRSRRIREDLGVELAYPSYREGLAAILAATRS
ncbi:MAG: SDR family oxidoreductase [Hyphomicrobium sp.]|uniref:SDR family oxidoreductase n=1 Tax=Hyphomicrobium sp. TaxID=82 RepID=UPI003D0E6C05